MTSIEVGFKQEPDDDKPEPLRMEHFYFPLGILFFGLLLAAISLLAEIIIKGRRKSKRDDPMATQEEPSIIQSSPESNFEDTETP